MLSECKRRSRLTHDFTHHALKETPPTHALQVPAGSPIFLIERTPYITGNRPVYYERLHYRGDLIRFVTRLARPPRRSLPWWGGRTQAGHDLPLRLSYCLAMRRSARSLAAIF